jgi:asparagine synthase (glutamine-hydrolysing)
MCGIVGLLSAAGMAATIGRTFVQDTLQLQHTRGPDDRGTVDIALGNFTLTLGHNRLSIIDLSVAGHQPMTDRSSAYTITYNGEIYNYIELKRELEDLGAQFGTRTDTEVILEAYRLLGTRLFVAFQWNVRFRYCRCCSSRNHSLARSVWY